MRALFVLLLTALTCLAKPVELEFPGLTERVLIELPDNYDASKTWPAVFYYQGTGGKPTTRFITRHTGRQDWIVVGMAYLKLSDSAAGTRQGKIAAQDHLRLEKLLKHYSENERLQEKEENPFGPTKTEAVKPNFPEIDRGIPRNPLIK